MADSLFGAPPTQDSLFGAPPAAPPAPAPQPPNEKSPYSEADLQSFRRAQGDVSLLKNELSVIRKKMQEMSMFHGSLHRKCDELVGYIQQLKARKAAQALQVTPND